MPQISKPVCFTFTPETNDRLNTLVRIKGPSRSGLLSVLINELYETLVEKPQQAVMARITSIGGRRPSRLPPPRKHPTPQNCQDIDEAMSWLKTADIMATAAHDRYLFAVEQRAAWMNTVMRLREQPVATITSEKGRQAGKTAALNEKGRE